MMSSGKSRPPPPVEESRALEMGRATKRLKLMVNPGRQWKLKDENVGCGGSVTEKPNAKIVEPKMFTTPASSQISRPTHTTTVDKLTDAPLPSTKSTTLHRVFATASPPIPYLQAPTAEFKGSMGFTGEKTPSPKIAQDKTAANNPRVSAPTWSLQSNSLSSSTMVPETQVRKCSTVKAVRLVGSSAPPRTALEAALDKAFQPFITQRASSVHAPMQTVKAVYTNHNLIAIIVRSFLQPKLPRHPTRIPPSREYMHRALTCQSCNVRIIEVDTVIICDACEKGFHLKCVESLFRKGFPAIHWHCVKCTSLRNGKPFPAKYGRAVRINTPLMGATRSTQAGAQSMLDKKLANMGQQGDRDKMSSIVQRAAEFGTADCSKLESVSRIKIGSEIGTPGNRRTACAKPLRNETASEKSLTCIQDQASVVTCSQLSQVSASPIPNKGSTFEQKLDPPAVPSGDLHDKHESKFLQNLPDVVREELLNIAEGPSIACLAGSNAEESETIGRSSPFAPVYNVQQSEEDVTQELSPSLRDDKQSEDSVACATAELGEPTKKSVNHKPYASQHNAKQIEQGVAECNAKLSHQSVADAHCPSEYTVKQMKDGVARVPFCSELIAKQSEQDDGHAPCASGQSAEQSQQGVGHAPSPSKDNMEGKMMEVAHTPSSLGDDVNHNEHGVATSPSASKDSIELAEEGLVHAYLAKNTETVDTAILSSEVLCTVDWVGDALKVVDDKTFYESCCIGGVVYKVPDHALFCYGEGKLIPSKLESMWEDMKTGSKWVTVSRCYLPNDLPEFVRLPFDTERNEVYDSNHEIRVMAGLIQGPCKVLPPVKYKEETERRSQFAAETNNKSGPVFLSKWFFDKIRSC